MAFSTIRKMIKFSLPVADLTSWYIAALIMGLILLCALRENSVETEEAAASALATIKGNQLNDRPCDEIYVVREGETLHTISDKCGDPYIVERNPHIHDPDDVFPGLVIKIQPNPVKV